MTSPEITTSQFVRAMVAIGTLLTGPKPLAERMDGLCEGAASLLNCDYINILVLDGDGYRGAYQHGLPPELAQRYPNYRVPRDKPIVHRIEACDSYLLFNSVDQDPTLARVARLTGVASVIIVPFTHPDGSPLGYLTAAYTTDKTFVSVAEAEITMGISRLAQTTLLRSLEIARRREVSQAMLQVADSERRRLSRDIHDDPLQRILGLRIGLEAFRERLDDPDDRSELDRFIEQCRGASASLREVMLRTHHSASEMADLEATLRSLIERGVHGPKVEFTFSDERSDESPSYLVPSLNRVAEQAARNTLVHADATQLSLSFSDQGGGTLLSIVDDGMGFDPSAIDRRRLGLVSMRERTELLGGTFSIESAPGQGTRVSAWFPHADVNTG